MSDHNAPVDPEAFKGALGSWAAGVTIVTTRTTDDKVYGLTVSSFSSLSIDPLLILVCIQNSNGLVEMVTDSKRFGVSVLGLGQDNVSNFFASSGRSAVDAYDDFETVAWKTGSPLIAGSLAQLDCELHEALPGGDHTIFIGKVVGVAYDPEKEPLIYYRRGYRKLTDI